MAVLGIDIGGTGIKGALVDVKNGELGSERQRLLTPEGGKPEDVAEVVKKLVVSFKYNGPIGCGFPAVVQHGVARTAANISSDWIGTNVNQLFSQVTGCPVYTLNDADAAGIAEMSFGVGRDMKKGVVLLLTLGTGIGSVLFSDGQLVPNMEFGHLKIRGKDAELRASDAVRQRKNLNWKKYARRLQEYLQEMEKLFSPDLIVIGGGLSKKFDSFAPLLNVQAKIVPAQLLNQAGIIGAAVYASQQHK
jgi:polyphosphate glucokinase